MASSTVPLPRARTCLVASKTALSSPSRISPSQSSASSRYRTCWPTRTSSDQLLHFQDLAQRLAPPHPSTLRLVSAWEHNLTPQTRCSPLPSPHRLRLRPHRLQRQSRL